MSVRTTTQPAEPPRSVVKGDRQDLRVVVVPSTSLDSPAMVQAAAMVAGLPAEAVRRLAAREAWVPLTPPLAPEAAQARLAQAQAHLGTAAMVGGPTRSGTSRTVMALAALVAGGIATAALTDLPTFLIAGLVLGVSAMIAFRWTWRHLPDRKRVADLGALTATALDGLEGPAAAWKAIGAMRSTLVDVSDLPRASISQALDHTEATLLSGGSIGPELAQAQALLDDLRAGQRHAHARAPAVDVLAAAQAAHAAHRELDGT